MSPICDAISSLHGGSYLVLYPLPQELMARSNPWPVPRPPMARTKPQPLARRPAPGQHLLRLRNSRRHPRRRATKLNRHVRFRRSITSSNSQDTRSVVLVESARCKSHSLDERTQSKNEQPSSEPTSHSTTSSLHLEVACFEGMVDAVIVKDRASGWF